MKITSRQSNPVLEATDIEVRGVTVEQEFTYLSVSAYNVVTNNVAYLEVTLRIPLTSEDFVDSNKLIARMDKIYSEAKLLEVK